MQLIKKLCPTVSKDFKSFPHLNYISIDIICITSYYFDFDLI